MPMTVFALFRNFTLYQTSSLGNCWTLSSPTMIAKTTGPRAGNDIQHFIAVTRALDKREYLKIIEG